MSVLSAERRRAARQPAVYPAVVLDVNGRVLASGRTADMSETGVLIMARGRRIPALGRAVIKLTLPAHGPAETKGPARRTVRYRCRIIRAQQFGQFISIGVELGRKLD